MQRVTPTELAETTYQASVGRRYRDTNGMPDPRRVWKPEADRDVLSAIIRRSFEAWVDELLPRDRYAQIAGVLDADLERRFDRDDMVVLDRRGFARQIDAAIVDVGGVRPLVFFLPAPRSVSAGPGVKSEHRFTALANDPNALAPIPPQLVPVFEPVVDAYAARNTEFEAARGVAGMLEHELKRRPIWAEIEAAFPRIGAWMAKMRES